MYKKYQEFHCCTTKATLQQTEACRGGLVFLGLVMHLVEVRNDGGLAKEAGAQRHSGKLVGSKLGSGLGLAVWWL